MIESKRIKNPFPGLRPFETDEYRLFFGREGQITGSLAGMVVGVRAVGGPIGFDVGLGLPIYASRSVEARGSIEGHAVYARASLSF